MTDQTRPPDPKRTQTQSHDTGCVLRAAPPEPRTGWTAPRWVDPDVRPAAPERGFESAPRPTRRDGRRVVAPIERRRDGPRCLAPLGRARLGRDVRRPERHRRVRSACAGRDRPTRPAHRSGNRSRSTSPRRSSMSPPRPVPPSSGSRPTASIPTAPTSRRRAASAPVSSSTRTAGSSTNRHVVAGSARARQSSSRTAREYPGTVYGDRHPDRPGDREGRGDRPARRPRWATPTGSRSASSSSRSAARSGLLEHRHERDRVGQGPLDPDRRGERPPEPHPDGRRDQPRQLAAARSSTRSATVIGINTAIARDSTGIGFSIPINIASRSCEQALAGEELARPYIGIRYLQIDAQLQGRDLPVEDGAWSRRGTIERRAGRSSPAARPRPPASRTATSSWRSTARRSTPSTRSTRVLAPVRARRHGLAAGPPRRPDADDRRHPRHRVPADLVAVRRATVDRQPVGRRRQISTPA